MKSIEQLSSELNNNLSYITNFEKTKVLVMVDRILSKPYTNHRMELTYYSIRYKTIDKTIYVYNKSQDHTDNFDFDCKDDIDFPMDFNVKLYINRQSEDIIKILVYKMKRVCAICLSLII